MRPLLSIAIPTFNRSSKLRRCLETFASEINDINTGYVEIIVSDNASTDETANTFSEWRLKHPSITSFYFKNNENFGVDANCHLAIKRSNGNYVWLFGDDDVVLPGAVDKIIALLSDRKKYQFCFVNYVVELEGGRERSRCAIDETRVLRGDLIFSESKFAISFASSCIFSGDSWRAFNFEKYIGSHWYHMFVARDLLRNSSALLIGEPLIVMAGGDLRSTRAEKRKSESGECEFYMAAHLNLVSFAHTLYLHGYGLETCVGAKKVAWDHNLRQIFYYKAAIAEYNWGEIKYIARKMADFFSDQPSFWLLHLPLLLLPPFIGRSLYGVISPVYKRAKRLMNRGG
jgi:glycosyltransferase involved in cell wall biosynthesis